MVLLHPGIKGLLGILLLLSSLTTAQKDNAEECSCFVTNGKSSSYFLHHRFWDFRHISESLISTSPPPVLQTASDTTNANSTSPYFSLPSWSDDWAAQTWNNSDTLGTNGSDATTLMLNSPNNVYITSSTSGSSLPFDNYTTFLTIRSARTKDFQSAGEIDTVEQNFEHLSIRYLARVGGSEGACAGLFTWRCPGVCDTTSSSIVEEADIEILTQGPANVVQYTNQPSEDAAGDAINQATRNVTLSDVAGAGLEGKWTDWNEYRYDWTQGLSTWFVNGTETASISFQAPKNPAQLILNMWGDGGSWTGNMTVGGTAYLQVQWIEVFYNTSGPFTGTQHMAAARRDEHEQLLEERGGGGCKVVCGVDGNGNASTVPGTPVVLNTNSAARARQEEIFSLTTMILMLFIIVVVN